MARAYIGTSGWNYRHWRGTFFPEELPTKQWLSFYASRFNSVEINYTFYRLPSKEACEAWYRQTPEKFRFVVKASRYITHIKRLRNVHESWHDFLDRVLVLKEKLGPILLQFPSNFRASESNLESVAEFLEYAGRADSRRLALEFRDRSCFEKEMMAVLRKHRAALVISHSSRYPVPEVNATSDFMYFRFHGPKEMFASSYSDAELREWATTMNAFLGRRRDVYAYFNNDAGGHAPRDAQVLLQQLQSSGHESHTKVKKNLLAPGEVTRPA
ncbi:MAG TPA: DUF72 domain-containing protein [Candidatus Binatus sp.]|uniref:DUF72 domain-containing protein n=1 Tax=Candidatus Binatus sp. TaxID=2811406 RepID=UPI002B4609E6|nr:DUF72 domain-containing protein [Candidatus Binatus sp.]HKN12750.1 DUF72 domain-containing protein [Candidatus Binatus sp.]